jgi:hypothetical protein
MLFYIINLTTIINSYNNDTPYYLEPVYTETGTSELLGNTVYQLDPTYLLPRLPNGMHNVQGFIAEFQC